MGVLADKIGFQRTFGIALCVFVGVYTVLAHTSSPLVLVLAMALYGIFAAGNDAVVKAWTTTTLPQTHMGRGLGVSSSLQSLTFLVASLLSGLLWQQFGSAIALSVCALGMLIPIIYFELQKDRLVQYKTQ
jgi:MFS family permease